MKKTARHTCNEDVVFCSKMQSNIYESALLFFFFLWSTVRFAQFAGAIVTIGTKFHHFGLTTADVELTEALVKFTREIVILHSDSQEVLLVVEAVEPVGRHLATQLVVIEVDLLQLAVADPGIAFRDASGKLCGGRSCFGKKFQVRKLTINIQQQHPITKNVTKEQTLARSISFKGHSLDYC